MATCVVQLEGGEVDVGLQQARVAGRDSQLTTMEAKLLAYLVREAGRDVPRGELLEQVWGYAAGVHSRTVDTTVRRLRKKIELDRTRPRHLLTVTGIGYRFEPLADAPVATPARRGNLHADPTSFVGRDAELNELMSCWEEGARLVTLVGPGGVGKTRLARRHALARERAGLQPGGAWFSDLSSCDSTPALAMALANCLDVRLDGELDEDAKAATTPLAEQLTRLGDALLVLDNFEQLPAEAAQLIATLLTHSPRTRMLVTSRRRLRLRGEHCLELAPLPPGPAARLFIERARAVARHIKLDPKTVQAVVRKLDGLPLAVELAAGRVNLLPLPTLLQKLSTPDGDAVEVLGHGPHDALSGTRTLQAAFDRSWALLTASERRALAQCALFAGPFDTTAAEALLEVDAPLATLQSLRDRSLLSARADGRLSMLQTLRAFANREPASEAMQLRHARLFVEHHYGREPDLERLAQDDRELEAIITRLSPHHPALAARAAVCLQPLLFARGPSTHHRALLAQGLALASRASDRDAEIWLRVADAEARASAGEVDAAVSVAEQAIAAAGQEPAWRIAALTARGNIARRCGDADAAETLYAEALAIAEQASLRAWQARLLRHWASLHTERGQLERARERFEQALRLYRALGDRRAEATVLGNLGNVFLELVRDDDAATHHRLALAVHRTLGDQRRQAIVLSNLAVVQHQSGDLPAAEQSWHEALKLHREVGNRRFEGFSLGGLAMIDFEQGRLRAARDHADMAQAIAAETQDRRAEAIALARCAALQAFAGEIERAQATFETARTLLGQPPAWWEAGAQVLSGFLDLARGDEAAVADKIAQPPVRAASSFQRISQRILRAAQSRRPSA